MTFEELDVALEELENRLERLRALYEQYFLGFEKIEPSVPRKDVDRRIYVLRREKIRNTGKRFKLQTIIQRYNTFQMYWGRICREIENGTYKRHLLRAERQMAPGAQLTIAARRRFGKLIAAGADITQTGPAATPTSAFPADEAATQELPRRDELPPDSDDFDTHRPPPLEPGARRGPPPKPDRPKPASSRPPISERLELDMNFLGSWVPPALNAAPKQKSSPRAAPPPKQKSSPEAAPPPKQARPAAPPKQKSSPQAAPPPKPGAPPKPQQRPAAEAPRPAGVSDDRVRDLHQRLSDLKKQNSEGTQVSLEALAKTIRDTEAKLRAQHKDRKIDFEVVLRDGKAIVKPTVR